MLHTAKSVLLLAATGLLLSAAFAQVSLGADSPSTNAVSSATQFVDLLVKEDYAGAVGRFDPTVKSALPEAQLREIWQTLQQQAGPFKKRLRAREESLGKFDVVFVTCHFERTDLAVKVVLDAQQKIAGLFFVPAEAVPEPSAAPPYANASAFHEQDFTVGKGEWALPGTLTLPVGLNHAAPAVVLVQGTGPEDRDETILANKPFRDLAWGLATKGIAVLRYEKRTRQYAAKLAASSLSQFTVKQETLDDALSAVAQLRATDGIDPKRIFVLGHSLGGTLAPRIGQADPHLAGLIVLAGATRPLEDLMIEQTRYLLSLEDAPSQADQDKLSQLLAEAAKVKKLTDADASSSSLILNAPPRYWLDLREHNPLAAAKSLNMPLLILQGGRDYQVTEADFDGWKNALASRPGVTFKLYPDLNHLFMAGKGKSVPAEYEHPGHVSEGVITDIADWILKTSPAP